MCLFFRVAKRSALSLWIWQLVGSVSVISECNFNPFELTVARSLCHTSSLNYLCIWVVTRTILALHDKSSTKSGIDNCWLQKTLTGKILMGTIIKEKSQWNLNGFKRNGLKILLHALLVTELVTRYNVLLLLIAETFFVQFYCFIID